MIIEIKMPKLGETMEEGVISKWRKKEGEKIEKGEILVEVMTDKANFEVESPGSGFIRRILAKEEETVPVTKVIGYLSSSMDEEIPAAPVVVPFMAQEPTIQPVTAAKLAAKVEGVSEKERIKASPLARRLAEEKGRDLSKIKGSGPDGRIEKEDVLKAIESGVPSKVEIPIPEGATVIPVTGVRKLIADRMTQSKQTVPHYYLGIEVDMTEAVELREKLKKEKVYFSLNDLLIKAIAEALKEFPVVNGYFVDGKIVLNPSANIGIAVARSAIYKTSEGKEIELYELVVPVLKDADKKNLTEIANESKGLIKKARENKLNLDELSGGTFTLSNLGTMGIDVFSAIINPPQATLLAIGEIKKRPAVVNDKIEIRYTMKASLSCDHRIVDGALGAHFLQKLKELLEKPKPIIGQK